MGLTETASPYHASGHISGPELRDLIRQIAPRRVIPVHTAAPRAFLENPPGGMTVQLPEVGVPIPVP